jgi:signal transduction histidine kinase
MNSHATAMFEDLMTRFQTTSESLERSYRELQDRVETLTQELEKEREEKIRLERLVAMGEMAMELAHEIRNPLGSIELFASMLEGDYAEQIVRSVRLLNHSVTNVLQFGKPIHPEFEAVSINELVETIGVFLQSLADQKAIHFEKVCEQACLAHADHELLYRMLLNLLLNALRETPRDGMVRLKARSAGTDVVLEVEDTGRGINKEAIARIFDPMFSTHREGCGLGLSIVKRIVDCHAGQIYVESSDKGTRFEIRLTGAAIEGRPNDMEVVSESIACCG